MKADYGIEVLCAAFCVSRSGYYQWLGRKQTPAARRREDLAIADQIRWIHCRSGGTYGTPRLHAELKAMGRRHGRKRVDRIRRQLGLCGRTRRRYRPRTTDSAHGEPIAANRLGALREVTGVDQVWVNDITYIETAEGWLYMAAILDLYSRRIVGWAFAHHLGSELVAAALRMALLHRRPPRGLIHHSDRGVQYASAAYGKLLGANGIVASMSRKGCCYDNAAMEAFFSTLKIECVYPRRFQSRQEARSAIFTYIEAFYNRRRRHSAIGYLSPMELKPSRTKQKRKKRLL